MLSPCRCTPRAEAALRDLLDAVDVCAAPHVEVEFRELPYFLVSRSQSQWQAGPAADVNVINILDVTERGLLVDAEAQSIDVEPVRRTLIPWQNIISLSLGSAPVGAGGS